MSTQNFDGIYSYPAAADYRTNQYQAVVINTSGQAVLAGANVAVDGLLDNAPDITRPARVLLLRGVVAKAKLGVGGATLGSYLTTDATGKLVIASTGQIVCAKAHRFAGAAGDIIEVLWYGNRGTVAP